MGGLRKEHKEGLSGVLVVCKILVFSDIYRKLGFRG